MGKREVLIFFVVSMLAFGVFFVSGASSGVDDEMKKFTHYAEEYETGNIDYVKFLIYSSSVRENLNELLGVSSREFGGVLKQEQIREVLGEPDDETKWVWVEGDDREERVDESVPVWRKIVFDGNKIQVRLEAYPSIFRNKNLKEEKLGELEKKFFEEHEGEIIYRLNFWTEFKKPKEQLDVLSKIDTIKKLAENFNADSSSENAEDLAKESVNAERTFENQFRQSSENCEALMNGIFGSESKRQVQKMLVNEIIFYEGENFDAMMRLEMCDDCEWNWINTNLWIEGRGTGFKPDNFDDKGFSTKSFEGMNSESFKTEARKLIEDIKSSLEQGDYGLARSYSNKLSMLNNAWNEEANNVWEEFDEKFRKEEESMGEEERNKFYQNYGWIEREQKKRQEMKEVRVRNYEERKVFYLDLFSNYEKKEYYFESQEWEKRLVEEFKIKGQEICDNNLDDNSNGNVDCDDAQCGGKICGKSVEVIGTEGEGLYEAVTELYCVAGICQVKEEIVVDDKPICGNNICEAGEMIAPSGGEGRCKELSVSKWCFGDEILCPMKEDSKGCLIWDCDSCEREIGEEQLIAMFLSEEVVEESAGVVEESFYCPQDCVSCPKHESISCSGKVVFGGEDEEGCPLNPVCVEEEEKCGSDDDCKFLCGKGECVLEAGDFGKCKLIEMAECEEPDCVEGEKKVEKCDNGDEVVVDICEGGLWKETSVECEKEGGSCKQYCLEKEMVANYDCSGRMEISGDHPDCNCNWICEDVVKEECTVKGDCGGENDVCSNGKCVTLPEVDKIRGGAGEGELQTSPEVEEENVFGREEGEEQEWEKETESGVDNDFEGDESESEVEGDSGEEVEGESEQESEPVFEPEPEEESAPEEVSGGDVSGNVVFNFFRGLFDRLTITGRTVDGGNFIPLEDEGSGDAGSDGGDSDFESDDGGDSGGDTDSDGGSESDSDDGGDWEGDFEGGEEPEFSPEGDGGDYFDDRASDDWNSGENRNYEREKNTWDNEERDEKDDEKWREKECEDRCGRECYDMEVRSCVESCIMKECGQNFDCDANEISGLCEGSCKEEVDVSGCESDCFGKCMKGEDTWKEPEREENKEEKGVFVVGGGCRVVKGETEGFVWFNGWGEPFEEIDRLKQRYYQGGGADWCKYDLENLIKQRQEFEKGFDQEFVEWLFESYLANSAEDWEQHVSGIYEIYWKDVDILREMAFRKECASGYNLPEFGLLNVEYETEYGRLKFWEEIKLVKMLGMDKEVEMISPYMEVWIFPSKENIKYMFKEGMEKRKMPGSGGGNEMLISEEEKKKMRTDEGFMDWVEELNKKYGENLVVQFKDREEIVFNIYFKINSDELIYAEPMPPSEIPAQDILVEMDFEKLYDIIEVEEKDRVEFHSPPWDKQKEIGTIKEMTSGVKMWWRFKALVNSVEVTPSDSKKYVEPFLKNFMKGMMGGSGGEEGVKDEGSEFEEEKSPEGWKSKETITGEVVRW
ncbi:MAG: hypothetical protein ABIG28_03070 [archaeon]